MQIQKLRDALNPAVMLDADEVGVILPDVSFDASHPALEKKHPRPKTQPPINPTQNQDNDGKYTSDKPGFPAIYWNAAAAMYAYLYGRTAVLGLDVLGESQLIGYPSIPFPAGRPSTAPGPRHRSSPPFLCCRGAVRLETRGTAPRATGR